MNSERAVNTHLWPAMSDLERWLSKVEQANLEIRLDKGQLDMEGPRVARIAGSRWLDKQPLGYCLAHPELVQAIQKHLQKTRCFMADPENLVITHGGIGGLSSVFGAVCGPGDEVLVPDPVWPAIPDIIQRVGAKFDSYHFATDTDVRAVVRVISDKISAATRIIVINSPHNPTGLTISEGDLRRLEQLAYERNAILLDDEAYDSFGVNGREAPVISAQGLAKGIGISVCSISKRMALPALRIGYVVSSVENAELVRSVHALQTGGVSVVCQIAAAAALNEGSDTAIAIREKINHRRSVASAVLEAAGFHVPAGRGSIYIWGELPDRRLSSWDVAQLALEEGVGVIPGDLFGPGGRGAVRVALTARQNVLEEGCRRLGVALRRVNSAHRYGGL